MAIIYTLMVFIRVCKNVDNQYNQASLVSDLATLSFFPDSLSAHFNSMDRYHSIAHFADFQVRSSLNRSLKDQWFALIKERSKNG